MSENNTEDTNTNVSSSNDEGNREDDSQSQSFMWRMLIGTIRTTFPGAKQLQTEKLAEWMSDAESRKGILLLDVREKDEFAVSTIEGSLNVIPDGSNKDKVLEKIHEKNDDSSNKIKKVVCFCSLGYRSAKMAQNLQKWLEKKEDTRNMDIFNLEGSLFKWANEKREMVDSQGNKTVFCHPYSIIWGKFLESGFRKYTP